MDKISIFIVDDHQIVIDGLKALLDDIEDFTIVGFSTQSKKVTQMLATLSADILLTDVMMPEKNGQALAKQIRTQFPDIKILALSMSGAGEIVHEMTNNADINGYVLKNIGKAELETAIRKIAGGGIYFGEEILTELEKHPR